VVGDSNSNQALSYAAPAHERHTHHAQRQPANQQRQIFNPELTALIKLL
jgi:hypothetical protein